MNFRTLFQSKTFQGVLYGIGIIIVLLLVFQIGVFVGFKKAEFTYAWGSNYYRNFAGPPPEFMQEFEGRDMMNGHGTLGSILKIEDPNIVIKGQDGVEKVIVTTKDTVIRNLLDVIKLTDLKENDPVVVIGSPNDAGQIEAKFVRVMPVPPQGMGMMMPLSPETQPLSKTQQP
jgi:hypothetical protein